jgi:hypothetical protein
VFTEEAFRHGWSVNEPEKFVGTYFAAAGNEPPLKILQYEGELTQDYMKLPKHRPDFQVRKSGAKPRKVFAWDPEKFKFVGK